MYTLIYNQLQFFHITLSKIKFAKLRNFVLSFIMLLNLGAEEILIMVGCVLSPLKPLVIYIHSCGKISGLRPRPFSQLRM